MITQIIKTSLIALILGITIASCNRAQKDNNSKNEKAHFKIPYRSVSFHDAVPDMELVRKARELGYNDVTLQTECWTAIRLLNLWPAYRNAEQVPDSIKMQQEMFKYIKRQNDSTGCIDEIKELGMTFSLWTHEIEDYKPEWGPIEADNQRLWDEIYNRYVHLCDTLLPQLDYIILTITESKYMVSGYETTMKLCNTIYEACKASDVQLIVRTFIYTHLQGDDAFRVFDDLPDDVIVMSKYGPKDWNPFGIIHPYFGSYEPKREILEEDIAGEYYKRHRTAHCMTKYLKTRFDNAKSKFDDTKYFWGINIRVNRRFDNESHWGAVLNEVQEADLWSFAYWATGKANDINSPVKDWAASVFGDSQAQEAAEIFLQTGDVIANTLFISSEPFGDTRKDVPGQRASGGYLKGMKEQSPWNEKARRLDESEILKSNITPYVQGRSNCTNDSAWIPNLIKLNTGDMEIIKQQQKKVEKTIGQAKENLEEFKALKQSIPSEKYEYYSFKLKENIYLARFYGHAGLAWLKASRRLYSDNQAEKEKMLEEVKKHLAEIKTLAEEVSGFENREFKIGNRTYHFKQADYGYQAFITNFKYHFDTLIP